MPIRHILNSTTRVSVGHNNKSGRTVDLPGTRVSFPCKTLMNLPRHSINVLPSQSGQSEIPSFCTRRMPVT
eukprot:10368-Rhodomonas_salina.1